MVRNVIFSNFCIGIHKRLYFLNCKHCVFWSFRGLVELPVLLFGNLSFTTFLSGFEINSFDTANNWKTGVVCGH